MKRKSTLFFLSVAIQFVVILLLATGSSFLVQDLSSNPRIPVGNVLTWILFMLFPLNFLMIRRSTQIHPVPRKVYYVLVYLGLILGFLWPFVSYGLAGNWSASFVGGGWKSQVWEIYTYATPLLAFAGYFLMRFLMYFFKSPSTQR